MTTAQSFLFFLILLGGAATVLRLVSRTTPTVPYPVLLAAGGIAIGLIPGVRLPAVGPDLILLAFIPGLVFEASLAVDLEELRRRIIPVGLLATLGVFLTVTAIGAMAHYGLGLDCARCVRRWAWKPFSRARACSTTAPESPSSPRCSAPS